MNKSLKLKDRNLDSKMFNRMTPLKIHEIHEDNDQVSNVTTPEKKV